MPIRQKHIQKCDQNVGKDTMGYTTGAYNSLLSDGVWDFEYDAEGNLTQKTEIGGDILWTYAYDHANHLTKVERATNDRRQPSFHFSDN